jgi:hypothetical protein
VFISIIDVSAICHALTGAHILHAYSIFIINLERNPEEKKERGVWGYTFSHSHLGVTLYVIALCEVCGILYNGLEKVEKFCFSFLSLCC